MIDETERKAPRALVRARTTELRLAGHGPDPGPLHRVDFLTFLRQVGRAYPAGQLHVFLDDASTRRFGILCREAIWRGDFASVKELVARIESFTESLNAGAGLFVWVNTADEIPAKGVRKPSASSGSGD